MVALMLNDAGMEAFRRPLDLVAVKAEGTIAYAGRAPHHAGHAGHRQAAFESLLAVIGQQLDLGIDEHGQRHFRRILAEAGGAIALGRVGSGRNVIDHQTGGNVHLRRRQADAVGVGQRIDHVPDEGGDFRRRRIGDGFGGHAQNRMAHAGDFQNSHVADFLSFMFIVYDSPPMRP